MSEKEIPEEATSAAAEIVDNLCSRGPFAAELEKLVDYRPGYAKALEEDFVGIIAEWMRRRDERIAKAEWGGPMIEVGSRWREKKTGWMVTVKDCDAVGDRVIYRFWSIRFGAPSLRLSAFLQRFEPVGEGE